jgi:dCTP diphosphatase
MTTTPTLLQLQNKIREFNRERDWAQYHSPRNIAMALSVEAGELLELFLWSSDDGPQPPVESRRRKVGEEAADVLICLVNFCDQMNIDLLDVTNQKIERNRLKYPVEKSIGRLEKHNELD